MEVGVADTFTQRFVDAVKALKMGAPDEEDNYIGPMARFDLRDELHQQVQATLAEGATLLLGGEKLAGTGNFYAPTVLGDVTPQMTAFRQSCLARWLRLPSPMMRRTRCSWLTTATLAYQRRSLPRTMRWLKPSLASWSAAESLSMATAQAMRALRLAE